MGKLILKTAAITLGIIVAVSVMAGAVFALAAPARAAQLCARMGMYGAACQLQCSEYNRKGNISELDKLVQYAVIAENHEMVVKYGSELVNREDFKEYASQIDQSSDADIKGSYTDYIYGNLSVSLYEEGNFDGAFVAAKYTVTNEYPVNNAMQYYIYNLAVKGDEIRLTEAAEYLTSLYWFLDTEQGAEKHKRDVALDLVFIYEETGNSELANQWKERL